MKDFEINDSVAVSIIAFLENRMTEEQAAELLRWIEKDEQNLKHFREIVEVGSIATISGEGRFDSSEKWNELLDRIKEDDVRPIPGRTIQIRLSTLIVSVAATIAVLVGIGGFFLLNNQKQSETSGFYEAVAPRGSRSVITLADGSTVWLNSGTKIRYDATFGSTTRNIFLEGEAYFSVVKNPELPFIVNTKEISVTALGTAFNVKAYNDEEVIETTLEEGEIKIEHLDKKGRKEESSAVILKPNQKAYYSRADNIISLDERRTNQVAEAPKKVEKLEAAPIRVDTLVDTKLSTSWKDSRWIFKSEKLGTLTPIIGRRYNVTISFGDTILTDYRFTGTIREESLEQVLKALALAAPIKYDISRNSVYLYADRGQIDRYQKQSKQNKIP